MKPGGGGKKCPIVYSYVCLFVHLFIYLFTTLANIQLFIHL